MHRSASQLLKYQKCSELYRLSYVDKPDLPYRPAAWLAQGTAFHETLRQWEESGRWSQFPAEAVFYSIYEKEIKKMKEKEPDLRMWMKAFSKKTEVDIEERRSKGIRQVLDYIEFCKNNPFYVKDIDDYTMGVEVPFELTIGTTIIRGAIDLIIDRGNGVEVRDLKTGNRESAMIQLGIYKVAIEKIFGWKVVAASFFYAKDNKVVTLTDTDLARYTEEYLTDIFSALDRGIENRVFIPNPGGHCTMCPVRDFCREMS